MAGPLILVVTARIKEGRLGEYEQFASELVRAFEAREPQIIAFNMYRNEDGTEMSAIQVHPDGASMDSHLRVLDLVLGEEMAAWVEPADFLEMQRVEIFGTPTEALLEVDRPWVESGAFSRTIKTVHFAGFTRSSAG